MSLSEEEQILNEREQAAALTKRVEAELTTLVQAIARDLNMNARWVVNEIIYQATQIARQDIQQRETALRELLSD